MTVPGTIRDRRLEEEIPHLRRYARSLTRDATDAEDLLQDCLERALSRLDQFEPGSELRRWLFTIMRNLHIDACRKARRRGPEVAIDDVHRETHQTHLAAPQEAHMEVKAIERRLRKLRRCDRQVILLSAFSTMSQAAIARKLDVAVGTVKSRLSRARTLLAA